MATVATVAQSWPHDAPCMALRARDRRRRPVSHGTGTQPRNGVRQADTADAKMILPSGRGGHEKAGAMLPDSPPTVEFLAAHGRADAIRQRIDGLADVPELIAQAYQAQDWKALGHESWEAYVHVEFGTSFIKLNRAMRREWTDTLKAAGMSTREIAPVTNVSQMQVSRDARDETNVSPKAPKPPSNRKSTARFTVTLPNTETLTVISVEYDAGHAYCPHCTKQIDESGEAG